MNNLSIPTDNLYKFIAIFGLVGAIFCFSYPVFLLQEVNKDLFEQDYRLAELTAKTGYLQSLIKDIRQDIPDSVLKEGYYYDHFYDDDSTKVTNADYIIPKDNLKDSIFLKKIFEYNQANLQWADSEFKYKSCQMRYDITMANYDSINISMLICGSLCVIISIIGMVLWYKKHQKFIDEEVKKQNYKETNA